MVWKCDNANEKNGRLNCHDTLLANIHSQIQQLVHSLTITIEKIIQLTPLVQYLFYLVQDTVDTISTVLFFYSKIIYVEVDKTESLQLSHGSVLNYTRMTESKTKTQTIIIPPQSSPGLVIECKVTVDMYR